MWIDLERERYSVLLTNRVHPSRTPPRASTRCAAPSTTPRTRDVEEKLGLDEERLHLESLDHPLHVRVGWARVEPLRGVQDLRQQVDVA